MTGLALFESNDKAMADVTEGGLVRAADLPGRASVMVRHGGRVAVFAAAVPRGAPVGDLAAGAELRRCRRVRQPASPRHPAVAGV